MVSESGYIEYKSSCPTVKDNEEGFIKGITGLVQRVLHNTKINIQDIQAVGVGCPGSIDCDNGVVLGASNPGLKNFPLKEKPQRPITGMAAKTEQGGREQIWIGIGYSDAVNICIDIWGSYEPALIASGALVFVITVILHFVLCAAKKERTHYI